MEHEYEVVAIMVKLACDECAGEMNPTGVMLMSDPPKYPHECDDCGHTEIVIDRKYPYVKYRPAT